MHVRKAGPVSICGAFGIRVLFKVITLPSTEFEPTPSRIEAQMPNPQLHTTSPSQATNQHRYSLKLLFLVDPKGDYESKPNDPI